MLRPSVFDREDANVKGKDSFTAGEAKAIRDLLRQVRRLDRNEQKRLRRILRRRHCFYITDFDRSSAGFTAADFDNPITRGAITIERS